ncbi:MAG: heavy-metal-associated domain-containing protein [Thermomicrobiales bacterium]|nr:heavy-metal-associated domain-containing protein [Thermomicrobiales bacterium]
MTPVSQTTDWTTTFDIEGMTCASCVRRVEKALEKVEGVHGVAVNLATETATVTADDVVTPETLRSAVEKAGYEAGAIDRPLPASPAANSDDDISLTFDIEGMTCASCVRRWRKPSKKSKASTMCL